MCIRDRGVHDMVKRSTRLLNEYEEKLHLVERFVDLRGKVGEIHKLTENEKDLSLIHILFYNANPNVNDLWRSMGVLAVEMEAAALYMNAAKAGKKALCMLTISDHLYTNEFLSAEDRQLGFGKMMEIALELA